MSSATSIDSTLPAPTADTVIGAWNSDADAIVAGPTVANISAAESNAVSAAASAVTAAAEASAANPKYTFSTTTSMADPGAGTLRYNHGTVASVSAIALDDTTADTGNPDIEAWIASWDDSTSTVKGWLRLVEPGTPANYAVFHITGLTNNSGWVQLAVTHVDSNGTFGNGDSIRVMFSRTGDKGETGSQGIQGETGAGVNTLTTRGDLLVQGASSAGRLAIGSSGRALLSDGTDPSWGQVSLTAGVTGTLPVGNGGTGVSSVTGSFLASGTHTALTAGFSTDIEDMGSSGTGTETVDLQLEALKTLTITGSSTFAPDASRNGIAVVLVTNDGTGGYTLTTSGWDHVIGTYDSTASKKHLFTCYSFGATDILRIEALS